MLILPLVFLSLCLRAQIDTAYPPSKISLLEKSRKQKKIALGCLIVGGTTFLVGAVGVMVKTVEGIGAAGPINDPAADAFGIVLCSGAAITLTSIPFSIASRRNRKKAENIPSVMLKIENINHLYVPGFKTTILPSVCIRFGL